MNNRTFIEDQTLVTKMLSRLNLIQEESRQCAALYIDTQTNEQWETYPFELEDQLDTVLGLRRFPNPSVAQTILIALSSPYEDEISGAAAMLYDYDLKGIEVRSQLLQEIEFRKEQISKERYEILYERMELYNFTNNRVKIGMSIQEIAQNAEYYIQTSLRAKRLKDKITIANT
jgi:hypothetical protein